jgi:hypothetical protein
LFEYWDRRRGNRVAPERSEIEPAAIRGILGDTFILGRDADGEHRFRLAGTKVCALFCRELKGQCLDGLWESASAAALHGLIDIVSEESVGLVAGARGQLGDGASLKLELLMLPLTYRGHTRVRLVGVLAPFAPPCWLGTTPLENLRLSSLRHLGPAVETVAAPRFATARPGRTRHGLVVYDGGRPQ